MQVFEVTTTIIDPDTKQVIPTRNMVKATDWLDVAQVSMKTLQTKDIISIRLLGNLLE